jgi:hypothetical protein
MMPKSNAENSSFCLRQTWLTLLWTLTRAFTPISLHLKVRCRYLYFLLTRVLALVEKRKVVLEKLKQFQQDCTPFTSLFEKPEVVVQMKASRDGAQLLEYLKENFNVCYATLFLLVV